MSRHLAPKQVALKARLLEFLGMPYSPVDDLRQEIANGHVLIVVGTGVSLAATGESVASWQGLLKNGVERCEGLRRLPASKAENLRADIDSGSLDRLLDAATEVRKALSDPDESEVRIWLRDTVGRLRARNREVLEAIQDLGLPIATTNYDDLLEQVTGWRSVTWLDGDRAIQASQGKEEAILHLHGHWAELDSVILDRESYERIRRHDLTQTILRGARTFKTLLFVGCGDGLSDPNFGALLEWAREVFRGMEGRHYRLCRESEIDTLEKQHREDHILPISYGPEYGDLAGYLGALVTKATKPADRPRLPGRPPRCFGREDEVRDLVESLLLPSPRPVPILGPPGVGKTTISLEAIHDPKVKARFRDRRFFVRCDGAKSKDALVTEIALTLGLESGPDLERRLFQVLENSLAVLLLDNAETPWHADTMAVEGLLTELSMITGVVLVASIRGDERPFGPRWREAIRVGPFGLPAARKTFVDIAGLRFQEYPDVDRLLEAVERLPIAVSLLAHQAEGQPLGSLWKRWQDKRTALLKNADGKERRNNFEVSLDFSLDSPRMTKGAKRLLSVLALLPDGVAHQDLAALLPGEAGEAAAVLRKMGLAFDQGNRLRVLVPIREYVRRQRPPKDKDLARTVDHYLKLARKGDEVGRKGGAEAVGQLVQELGNLNSMILKGLKHSDPDAAILAAVDLGELLRFAGWGSQGPLERALRTARTAGKQKLEANCIQRLGDIALALSDYDAARARYEEALPLFSNVGSVLGKANCIQSLGNIALRRSDYDAARACYEAALPLFRNVGDIQGEANCIQSLGDIALDRLDHDAARACYEEALPLFRNVGSVLGEANCILRLGDITLALSDYDAARARYEEALPLFRDVGDVQGEANCIHSLGNIALDRLDHDAARACYEEALPLFRDVGSVLGEANCIQRLGDIAFDRSDHDAAHARFREALGLFERILDPYSIGAAYLRLARSEPVGSSERRNHARAARDAWLSIKRPDLVEVWLKEFGEDFE
ncbi:MAG TPA: tetratricopeptide repeat protein [Thermoanaerobaculia bacterium]|jgi:tetratricopeptide (TPR) repeat protein|nr:tetratricopeptide repeat protein [Thermoanaerobaculia bacterium]